jgi:phage tail sheath protein FI
VPRLVERMPELGREEIFTVQQAQVAHCESLRDRVAILDPPPVAGADGSSAEVSIAEIQAWRRRFDTSFAALYHGWVLVYDPRQPRGVRLRAVPPSGHVAGVCARIDLAVGVHKAPANEELEWAQGLLPEIGSAEQGLLNPMGINCLRTFPGRGLRIYGARTVTSDTPWRYLPVRRLMLMIEEALQESMAWAVFEPHDVFLRQTLSVAIGSFLESLWARGALAGSTPSEAFFVKCDAENNPQESIDRGELWVEVGVAPVMPAEFVVFRIGRTEDALAVEESSDGGGVPWR